MLAEVNKLEVQNNIVLDEKRSKKRTEDNKKTTRSFSDTLLNIAIVILVIVTVLMFSYKTLTGEAQVRGKSMENTLVNDEKLMYEKLTTFVGDYNKKDILIVREDTVKQANEEQEGLIVKRLIAKGGDTLTFSEDGKPIVNGEVLDETYIKEQNVQKGPDISYIIERTNDKYGVSLDINSNKIPDGYYFVMGDNRNNSSDSRVFGLFKKDDIKGRVIYSWTYNHFY